MLLRWGDCHQFVSWHLNHPLQIWAFEMQIQLRLHGQIKRRTHEWWNFFLRTYIWLFYHLQRQALPSLCFSIATQQIMRLRAKTHLLYSFVQPTDWERNCVYLALGFTSWFDCAPQHTHRNSEKIWFSFFPLSPSLWHYSYSNINSNTSSLACTLSHIDICIWSLLLVLCALLHCVSFNR